MDVKTTKYWKFMVEYGKCFIDILLFFLGWKKNDVCYIKDCFIDNIGNIFFLFKY